MGTGSEYALRESEARFHELADNISQFAWTADQSGWIYWYNERWDDHTGTMLEEIRGGRACLMCSPLALDESFQALRHRPCPTC